MPIRFDSRNQRWRFEFDQVIAGQRQRASRLLPKGYTKAEAQKFDLEETKRLHSIATGVSKPEPLIKSGVLAVCELQCHYEDQGARPALSAWFTAHVGKIPRTKKEPPRTYFWCRGGSYCVCSARPRLGDHSRIICVAISLSCHPLIFRCARAE